MSDYTLISNYTYESFTRDKQRLNASHYLFLLFWLLKPFYFWESGSMQVSDFVFIASFLAWVIINRGNILIEGENLYFVLFIALTFVVNTVYMIIRKDVSFLLSTLYYIYNFMIILIFSDFKQNKAFLKALLWTSVFNLFVQLLLFMTRIGQFFWGEYRFMGSFNDPNQFSFSVFTSFLIIYMLSQYFRNQESRSLFIVVLGAFLLAFYFVVQGSSTGMLLGFAVFVLAMVLVVINIEKTPGFMFLKFMGILLLVGVVILVAVMGVSSPDIEASPESNSFLFYRLTKKLDILGNDGFLALLKDRGIDKLVNYPQYLIFGVGEGNFMQRFPESPYEVHSTFPGILFSYGIIPMIVLCVWIWHQLKDVRLMLAPVYIALLAESLTLANQRQPAFWIIIMLGSLSYADSSGSRFKLTRKI